MKRLKHSLPLLALLLAATTGRAEVKLHGLFNDHMVLQRGLPVPIWGTADPGEAVSVTFREQSVATTADDRGQWKVELKSLAPGEPATLSVSGKNSLTLSDVLVGDVWLCSGQSNMGMSVRDCADAPREIAAATFPGIRFYTVPQNPSLTPATEVKSTWQVCSPETVGGFSGAAYFFGRELHGALKVPIGLIHSSVGGTPAEAWTRREALSAMPVLAERADQEAARIRSQAEDNRRFVVERAAWEEKYGVSPPPQAEAARDWADPALTTDDWQPVTLPAQWQQLGAPAGGVFWVRKDVVLPEGAAGLPFSLSLNWVSEQYDTPFFNGVPIGSANNEPPDFYNRQRRYNVPGALVKAGRNVIAVRIVSATHQAGLWQWAHMLDVPVADVRKLDNQWLLKTESTFPPLPPEALPSRPKPNTQRFSTVSSALYNGMIAPLIPFAIKGAIWYQGENNAGQHAEYRELLSAMIRDWRAQWGQGDFPFLIQQLVNHGAPPRDENQPDAWPRLREAQRLVAETVPSCGLATGIELGDALTIHPKNKQEIGRRLALVALEKAYGQKVESSGPRYDSMQIVAAAIRVKFTHAEGLAARGGEPQRCAIAGADRQFASATARIDGDTLVVSSPEVPRPVAVRYAWAENPEGANLCNAAGLSAAPFRTDDWQ